MYGYINGIDFFNLEAMKYYAPPAGWASQKKKDNAYNKIMSGEYLGAQKRDGAWYMFIKDEEGNCMLRGRSRGVDGSYLDKWDHLPQLVEWADSLPDGTCVIGEVYVPGREGSKNTTSVMGCLTEKAIKKQQDPTWRAHYYVFEVLALGGQLTYNFAAAKRFEQLIPYLEDKYAAPCVEYAHYIRGLELWNELQAILARGEEGIVLTYEGAVYEPGKRPSKTTLKVKKELEQNLDLIIIGANPPTREYNGSYSSEWTYWENIKTGERREDRMYQEAMSNAAWQPVSKAYFYNWAGSFKLGVYNGDEIEYLGDVSGLTDEQKENWQSYVGKVVEINGMQIDDKSHHIRHPKMKTIRDDKSPRDCTIDQLYQ